MFIMDLKDPPEAKHFLWKASNSWIHVNAALAHRGIPVNNSCFRCSLNVVEDVNHALWYCPSVRSFWKQARLWYNLKISRVADTMSTLVTMKQTLSKDE